MKKNTKLGADSGFSIPAVCTYNGATNVKSIRFLCSSRIANKHKKGKKLSLRSHELFLSIMEKKLHSSMHGSFNKMHSKQRIELS